MRRGYVRGTVRFPADDQHDTLAGHAVKDRYEEGRCHETIDHAIKGLRSGAELWVTALDRVATRHRKLRLVVEAVHKRGCVIVEADTGRRSDNRDQCMAMIFDAISRGMSEERTATLVKAARKSGEVRSLAAFARRMPIKQAKQIWTNNGNWSGRECLAHMPGWTQTAAYEELGTRKLGKGRPRKEKE